MKLRLLALREFNDEWFELGFQPRRAGCGLWALLHDRRANDPYMLGGSSLKPRELGVSRIAFKGLAR